jgi:phosphohistidine swiveling domain-containing protein
MNAFLAFPILGPLSRRVLHVVDARVAGPVDRLVREGILRPRRLAGSRAGLALRMGAASLGGLVRLTRGLRPERCLAALEKAALAIDARPEVSTLSNGELLDELRLWLRPEASDLRDGLQMEAVAILVYSLASHAFRRHPRAQALLATGIAANPTTQISIAIDDLVLRARPLESLFLEPLGTRELLERLGASGEGRAWRDELTKFLSRFGHRGPMEFDIGASRWAEDPTMILDLVRAGLRSRPAENVRQRMERFGLERRSAIDEAVANEPFWKRPLLRRLARRVERHMPLREAPKHYGIFVFRRIRQAAAELGARLARAGTLRSGDDVFFLTWDELHALARGGAAPEDVEAQIDARKEQLARFRRIPAQDLVRSDGVPVFEDEPDDGASPGVLRGTPVSSGTTEGPVLVLREPAAGVVMEVGGMMCHAAVVAREMGVPAVFAVRNATSLLRDGERVAIDGTKGTVTRLEAAPPAQCDPSAPAK